MAVRTTALAVSKIIQVDVGLGSDLESLLAPFIETASLLITDVCGKSEYTEAKFELIERWLAAHLYGCFDPQLLSERPFVRRNSSYSQSLSWCSRLPDSK